MSAFQPLPYRWLLSDVRNDDVLERALVGLPSGSGFVFRHYHLPPEERRDRFRQLQRICRARDHLVILADTAQTARKWGADGIYGAPNALGATRADLLTIATAHNMREIAQAGRMRADAVMLSPAFPTRSHPGAASLGPMRFRTLAKHAQMPVIALGGMNLRTAQRLRWPSWAAIDGLSYKV